MDEELIFTRFFGKYRLFDPNEKTEFYSMEDECEKIEQEIRKKFMAEHINLNDISEFCIKIEQWLKARYGEVEGSKLWELTSRQYDKYLEDFPDYGGKKTSHALAIYGSIVIFSMYPLLQDHPPVEELQELVTNLFMSEFVKLGKLFNLNRSFDMWLINKVL